MPDYKTNFNLRKGDARIRVQERNDGKIDISVRNTQNQTVMLSVESVDGLYDVLATWKQSFAVLLLMKPIFDDNPVP